MEHQIELSEIDRLLGLLNQSEILWQKGEGIIGLTTEEAEDGCLKFISRQIENWLLVRAIAMVAAPFALSHSIDPTPLLRLAEVQDHTDLPEARLMVQRLRAKLVAAGGNATPSHAPVEQARQAADSRPPSKGMASHMELAAEWDVNAEAARNALNRWRKQHAGGDGYMENSDARQNQPKWMYNRAAVYPVMSDLKNRTDRREILRTKTSGNVRPRIPNA